MRLLGPPPTAVQSLEGCIVHLCSENPRNSTVVYRRLLLTKGFSALLSIVHRITKGHFCNFQVMSFLILGACQ